MEVEAINRIGADPGDRVEIQFDSGKLMRIFFLVYLFPVLCMILGALAGLKFSPALAMSEEVASVLGGFGFFGLAFLIVRWSSEYFSAKKQYKPQIKRIIVKAVSSNE